MGFRIKILWKFIIKAELVTESLLPQKRGPKFKVHRTAPENDIVELRKLGNNRYAIKEILKRKYQNLAPSETTIYNICKKHNLNRLTKAENREKTQDNNVKSGRIGTYRFTSGIE